MPAERRRDKEVMKDAEREKSPAHEHPFLNAASNRESIVNTGKASLLADNLSGPPSHSVYTHEQWHERPEIRLITVARQPGISGVELINPGTRFLFNPFLKKRTLTALLKRTNNYNAKL